MTLGELIRAQREQIIQSWASEVKKQSGVAARALTRPELLDNIPGLLDELVSALLKGTPAPEESPNAVEHGKQRLRVGFDLSTVVREYGILRNRILDAAERAQLALAIHEVRLLGDFITSGVAEAVSEYSGARRRLFEIFVGVLGHDLKNPLNAISTGALTLLHQAGSTPEVVMRVCSRIASSVDRMNGLVDQMLDFSRAGVGGGFSLTRRWSDLAEVVTHVVRELELVHPGRTIEVRSQGACTGSWDADRIGQALSHLISNGLRHGSQQHPVTVDLVSSADEVSLSVHNLGNPIPADSLRTIFDPFARGSDPPGAGIGLGLYLVREIVREHEGTTELESSAEAGTTFRIRLPRRST